MGRAGITAKYLDVPFAFHSKQLDHITTPYEHIAKSVQYGKPRIPVVSTCLGTIIESADVFGPSYLAKQTRDCVDFVGALNELQNKKIVDSNTIWIEVGLRPTCLFMVQSTLNVPKRKLLPSLRPLEDNWLTVPTSLAKAYRHGHNISLAAFHRQYDRSLRLINLPTYAFDLKNYWIKYEGIGANTKALPNRLFIKLNLHLSSALHYRMSHLNLPLVTVTR